MRKTIGIMLFTLGAALLIAGTAFLLLLNKPTGTAREHYNQGLRAAESGNSMAAISEYSAAIELNPGFVAAYRKRAEAYRSKGDLFGSADDYETLIKAGSKDRDDYIKLMSIYISRGDQVLAYALADRASDLYRSDPDTWQAVGDLYFKKGLYSEALKAYANASSLRPTSARPWISEARIHEILSDYESAGAAFDSAVAAEPKNPMYLFIRANYQTRRKQYLAAIADYEAALTMKPGYYEARVGIGRSYFLLGDYRNAYDKMTAAIKAAPDRFEAYRDRVDVYVALGETEKAADDCRAALNRVTNKTDKSRIAIKLQKLLY